MNTRFKAPIQLLLLVAASAVAQDVKTDTRTPAQSVVVAAPVTQKIQVEPAPAWKTFQLPILRDPFQMKYSRRGLELQTKEGRYTARIRWRVQARYSNPFDDDRRKISQFGTGDADHLVMRRARFKVEGRMFGKLVNYKYEQDLVAGRMIDLYADFNLKSYFKIRAGQWKSVFSQERYISSGSQQLVERSILNREFTVDRQSGAMLFGRVKPGKRFDSSYFLEILGGSGINSVYKDGSPMIVARYQWNLFGREPEVASSDI
jgi:phosphate-selective porin